MLRNAQQLLRIVKATFTDTHFDGQPDPSSCNHPSSDAERLHCLWDGARAVVNDQKATTTAVLAALTAVCQSSLQS